MPSLIPRESDVIVLVEGQAGHVFKVPRQFKFAAEVENHCSRLVLQRSCMHMCVPHAFTLYIPKFTSLGSSFPKPIPTYYGKAWALSQMFPEAPPGFRLDWSLPASDFLFALSTPSHSCLPPEAVSYFLSMSVQCWFSLTTSTQLSSLADVS